jgi:hypothetical protein
LQILFCLLAFNVSVTLNYFIKYFLSFVTCLSLRTNFRSDIYMSAIFPLKGTCWLLTGKLCAFFSSPLHKYILQLPLLFKKLSFGP